MFDKDNCIKKEILLITLIIISFLLTCSIVAHSAYYEVTKPRIAVFPFNDIQSRSLDMNIPVVLKAELSGYDFLETVPVEIVSQMIYEIEPSYFWTEREGVEKTGGILWRMEPTIIEEVKKNVPAEFTVYGDITRFGRKWRIDVYLLETEENKPGWSLSLSGEKEEAIPDKLTYAAKKIADRLKEKKEVYDAEEDIRRYMGGLYTYETVMKKIKVRVKSFPESIRLRALLLDLYIKKKRVNEAAIIEEGLKIMKLYDPSDDEVRRYFLSLDIDPFNAVAEIYEERKDWDNAIEVRNKALKLFPYGTDIHRSGLGKDHYYLARTQEDSRNYAKAIINYKRAMTFLPASSKYFKHSMERADMLIRDEDL